MQTRSTQLGKFNFCHPDVIQPHHESLSRNFHFLRSNASTLQPTPKKMCQISLEDLPRNNLAEIQPLPFCNCWWNLMQRSSRTKRKSVQEPTGTVRRKRLAFGVPKDAATKTT